MSKKFLQQLKKDQSGMAILMIVSAITLLTFLLADFTFETKLNKIKASNYQDRIQARACAESGLKLALAKLKLYREANNMINKNKTLKDVIKPGLLEQAVTSPPFRYPIPEVKGMNLLQKSAINDFMKETILNGEISVSISSVKGFLNPNNMRVIARTTKDGEDDVVDEEDQQQDQDQTDEDKKKKNPRIYIQEKLTETLKNAIDSKKEKSEEFEALYGNIDPAKLIKELKFFISDPSTFNDDLKSEFEALYAEHNVTPKYAPLTSLEELYLLQGWPDDIIDLVKNKMTVHEAAIIQVNEITSEQIKILFPNISPEQIEEFFKYRDGDQETEQPPKKFDSAADFKNVIVSTLGILDEASYDERAKEFENAGMKIGVAGKLFKVVSEGAYNRAKFKISAYVDLPIKPEPPKKKKKEDPNKVKKDEDLDQNPDQDQNPDKKVSKEEEKKKEEPKIEYLEPRIVEIIFG